MATRHGLQGHVELLKFSVGLGVVLVLEDLTNSLMGQVWEVRAHPTAQVVQCRHAKIPTYI